MSDLIFKKDGEEYICIPSPFSNNYYHLPKCPETKLEIKMTEQKITLELTIEELKLIDKHLWISGATKPILEKIKQAYPQPKMEYQESGTVDKVEYNGHTYLRIMYDDSTSFGGVWWKQIERHKSPMNVVFDNETRNILEGLWYNQVKKDEPTKPMDEVVERLTKKYQAQKLYNQLIERGYCNEHCDEIVDLVEDWLPEPQNASGSQNVDTELLVDGFNDCVRKMKEMLR